MVAETEWRENCAERLFVASLVVKLDKIRDIAGSAAIDVVINVLHEEGFNLFVFKEFIESNGDFKVITQDISDLWKVC